MGFVYAAIEPTIVIPPWQPGGPTPTLHVGPWPSHAHVGDTVQIRWWSENLSDVIINGVAQGALAGRVEFTPTETGIVRYTFMGIGISPWFINTLPITTWTRIEPAEIDYLVVVLAGTYITPKVAKEVVITYKNGDADAKEAGTGTTQTDEEGTVTLAAVSADGAKVDVSLDDNTYAATVEVTLVSGTITDDIYFDTTNENQAIYLIAYVDSDVEDDVDGITTAAYGTDSQNVIAMEIVWTTQPSAAENRDSDIAIAFEVQDGSSNTITTAASVAVTLTLNGADASDTINTPAVTLTNGVSGAINRQITGGAGTELGVTFTATDDDGFVTTANSSAFDITLITTAVNSTTQTGYQNQSYKFDSGYTLYGTSNSAGWTSEWGQARTGTVDAADASDVGTWESLTDFFIKVEHRMQDVLSTYYPVARIYRGYLQFNIAAYKGTTEAVVLRFTVTAPNFLRYQYDGTAYSPNLQSDEIHLYSISAAPTGANEFDKFNDLLTKAVAGTIEHAIVFSAAKTSIDANNYLDFTVAASTINNAAGDYVYFAMLMGIDYTNSMMVYPGNDDNYYRPSEGLGAGSNTVTLRIVH